jgi:hypothetical protein
MTNEKFRSQVKRFHPVANGGDESMLAKLRALLERRRQRSPNEIRACVECGLPAKGERCSMHAFARRRKRLLPT